MTNEQLFRIVIDTNKVYIKALEDGADKDTQETLLRNCENTYRKLVLDRGLGQEYQKFFYTERCKTHA